MGEAADYTSALSQIEALKPQVAFLDHVLKTADGLQVLDILKSLSCSSGFRQGKRYISSNLQQIIEANYTSLLTAREIEVIRLISSGRSNKEVAQVLGCTDHTIKTHKANIMEKLGYANTVEVSVWVSKNGLI